jgi:cytochrome c oxidase subunit I
MPLRTNGEETRVIALRDAGRWFAVAVTAVGVAGLFALLLVVARIPGVDALMPDPEFFWRALIVHVNLALGVWFFGFLAGLFCLLPGVRKRRMAPAATALAVVGMLAFSAAMFLREATPIRSNYVPVLDHWLFLAGLGMFAGAVALTFVDRRMLPGNGLRSELFPDAHPALRAAAIAYVTALATFAVSWSLRPEGLEPLSYYEGLFWGGGHVLQFVNVLAMMAAWLILLGSVLKRPVLHGAAATLLATLVLLPALLGPWVATLENSTRWFTEMMRWGIFPGVTLTLIAIIAAIRKARRRGEWPAGGWTSLGFMGFATSAVMTIFGFLLGAAIRGDTTLVPAHYHMSIGAVTAAFMATMLLLLKPLGAPLNTPRTLNLARWQPVIFGVGQAVMAFGFAIAGVAGAERKAYGSDQMVRSTWEWFGLWVMGAGGLAASVAGVMFLVLIGIALKRRKQVPVV